MTTAKTVILTAIAERGVAHVRANAGELAEELFCSRSYVLSLARSVEKGRIVIRRAGDNVEGMA